MEPAKIQGAPDWGVLLSIRAKHAANIYAGTKTVELRKTVPNMANMPKDTRYPFRVFMYESKAEGGAGAITGFFDCGGYYGYCGGYPQEMADAAQVSMEYLKEYAADGWLYAWMVTNPTRFPEPVQLHSILFSRPPQSWRYMDDYTVAILEAAAGNPPGGMKPLGIELPPEPHRTAMWEAYL